MTIRDVAAAAGVDISTVSKVLSGANISVRDATRARIEAAAASLNYRPNASARSLRMSRTGAFGMLVPDFTNPVYAEIVRGAVREAESRGRVILLAELDPSHSPAIYLRLVQERRIDGLLVATARSQSPILSLLETDEVPHVFINRRGTASSLSVVNDDEEGAAVGARALIEAGHRRLGIINGPPDIDTAQRRLAGFERAREQAGLPPAVVVSGAYSAGGGHSAARELLARPGERPTAVLVSNLTMALGALAAFAECGVAVPGDMSVVGFDDGELAAVAQPPLTCVAMPHDQMGAMAVELLESVLAGEPAASAVVPTPPTLVFRSSVAPPRI
ncbi:MAG TPA: LacI family DNA-binding transcriptional regulator [Solirubrobacteraceae bacterium]|nr:LacI family DNA-binding transcriptional regulator [Solirubrobacteraceae bacterium]